MNLASIGIVRSAIADDLVRTGHHVSDDASSEASVSAYCGDSGWANLER